MTGEDEPLTEEQLAGLEKDYPGAVQQYRERQNTDMSRDQPFEPRNSAQGHDDYSRMSREQADAERKRLMTDEDFLKDLRSSPKFSEPAFKRLDTLARIASGEAAPDERQADADSDYKPQSANEYRFDTPHGKPLADETQRELNGIKGELFKAGAHAGISNAIFREDFAPYVKASDQEWRSRIETVAAKIAAKPGGKEVIADAERYLNSGISDVLLEACAVACGSEIGVREVARLGRMLARKSAH